MSQPLVSIILVNFDCGRFIELIFPCILRQIYSNWELLVMDNGSIDGSCEQIEKEYPQARVIRLGTNTGFSHALNEGIRLSQGDYVLSLNFDVILEPSFLSELVLALERKPEAGWAAGFLRKLLPEGVMDSIDCNGHYWLPSRYCYGNDPAHPEPDFYDKETYVFGASACAALYKRSMLLELSIDGQIFDEELFAYFEDVDLDWRAQQRGYKCIFTPKARGAHMRGGTRLIHRPEIAALYLSNRFLIMIKNDEWRDFLKDFFPIFRRTLRDVYFYFRRAPRSLGLAAWRILRLAPRMIKKRRKIKQSRSASREYIASLRLKTNFLG